jgi:transcriptional regulator with XRE-family HTH domain
MPSAERRVDRGARNAAELVRRLGQEMREARVASGLSQTSLGSLVGISHTEISRLERGLLPNPGVSVLSRCFAVLGMRLSAKGYPEGPPVRDVAQARLLGRLRGELHTSLRMRTEVPLRTANADLRAWDAEVAAADASCKVEAETRLRDIQAVDRRIALKMNDDQVAVVILLVAQSRSNAAVLREFRELLRPRFPLDTRDILRPLRDGTTPEASGICVL